MGYWGSIGREGEIEVWSCVGVGRGVGCREEDDCCALSVSRITDKRDDRIIRRSSSSSCAKSSAIDIR